MPDINCRACSVCVHMCGGSGASPLETTNGDGASRSNFECDAHGKAEGKLS